MIGNNKVFFLRMRQLHTHTQEGLIIAEYITKHVTSITLFYLHNVNIVMYSNRQNLNRFC